VVDGMTPNGRLELPREVGRIAAGEDQIHYLAAELR
jgi:hypothetical protein